MNTINRLQLRHHTPIFETREAAIEYIYSQIRFADEGLAFEDKSYGFSLLGEPTVLLYKNVTEADPTGENDPHLIFVIGSATNDGTQYNDNRFCIIDIDKTEKEIEDLWEELEKAIKSLTIFTRDTNTLKLYSEKTEDGTIISGDVVVATSQIFDDARKPNIILSTDDGLFTYVNMEYDKDNDLLTFTVNGDTKQWLINNNYLVAGWYSKKDESLHLKCKDETEIVVSLENLIDEWGVEGEASNTPIVLTKEDVGYGDDSLHNHVEPWQDVLKADVRLADRRYNILKKTSDGRYLYVDGLANNIIFFKDGEEMTVQEALTDATKGVSNDSTNIIYEKADGYYSTATLKYLNKENKLVFTTSNVTGGTSVEEIKLNSVEAFKKIVYDPLTETLIIMYVDGNGDIQECDVPIGEMMQDWEWDIVNDGHNVKLHKQRVVGGNDKVSADVAIYEDPDNILVDKNHELFVKGAADNIRYGRNGNVSDELDKLNANDADINAKLTETSGKVDTLRTEFNAEVNRATSEEQRIEGKLDTEISRSTEKDAEHDSKISTIEQTIGDGFTIDGHETVTYKFNELSAKTNTISAKTDTIDANLGLLSAKTEAEIVRANSEEQRIEKKFDDELGDGFNIRNTVRDEFNREKAERVGEDTRLQADIASLSDRMNEAESDIDSLENALAAEISRAEGEEQRIEEKLDREISRSTTEDDNIWKSLRAEVARSTEKDNEHDGQIAEEIQRAKNKEHELHDEIVAESISRASGYTELDTKISSEITRATNAESSLTDAINNEASRAATKEAELVARVRLDYNAASNQLILEKANGSGTTYDTVKLNAGSLIDAITYDSTTKELVIRWHSTDDPQTPRETRVNVEDLFNPWLPNNPSVNSAVELTLTRGTGPLGEDQLSSKVLITDDHDGDGKPDQGSDNVIEIRNNGLYVNGSAISGAVETAECAKNELRAVEKAVIGHIIAQECGSGYTYEPNNLAAYISTATSFNNADFILDQNLKRVEDKIDGVSGDTECIDNKANKLYQLLYGATAPVMPNCGSGVTYQPYVGACVISGASSFMEADQMLNDQICEIMEMWVSGETCTTKSEWVDDGANKKMIVDVKLSRGNGVGDKFVEDEEIIILVVTILTQLTQSSLIPTLLE